MSETHLDRWYRKQRDQMTVRLRDEIRPLPTLDPGTDRPDDTEVWLSIAHCQSAVLSIIGMSDEELCPHIEDLRRMAVALNQRITSIED